MVVFRLDMNTSLIHTHRQPQPQPIATLDPPTHFFDGFFASFSRMYRHEVESLPTIVWHHAHLGDAEDVSGQAKKDIQDYLDSILGIERIASAKALFLCALNSHQTSTFMIHYSVLPWIPMPGQSPDRGNTLRISMLKEPNEVCHKRNLLMEACSKESHRLESFAEDMSSLAHDQGWKSRRSKPSEGAQKIIELIKWR